MKIQAHAYSGPVICGYNTGIEYTVVMNNSVFLEVAENDLFDKLAVAAFGKSLKHCEGLKVKFHEDGLMKRCVYHDEDHNKWTFVRSLNFNVNLNRSDEYELEDEK